jgi:DNA-binding PadR family transcriptional regulator
LFFHRSRRASERPEPEPDMDHDIAELQPVTPLTLHIMVALAQGALHGYAVIKAVARSSEGTIAPGAGTFYSAINRMERQGLIAELDSDEEHASPGKPKRTFELTERGRRLLEAETARLQRLVDEARAAGAAASSPRG